MTVLLRKFTLARSHVYIQLWQAALKLSICMSVFPPFSHRTSQGNIYIYIYVYIIYRKLSPSVIKHGLCSPTSGPLVAEKWPQFVVLQPSFWIPNHALYFSVYTGYMSLKKWINVRPLESNLSPLMADFWPNLLISIIWKTGHSAHSTRNNMYE